MKKIIIAAMVLISLKTFAQSYMVMENGLVLTTDKSGFVYDFGHYAFPQKITLRGGRYFIEQGNILATVDENGLLFRKYELIPSKIIGKGINYFISQEGFLYAIDAKGFLKVSESETYQRAIQFGGNYFTVSLDEDEVQLELRVVLDDGTVITPEISELDPRDTISYGGNYFMTNRGEVYTVSSDGKVTLKNDFRVSVIEKKGGNFFIDSSGLLFTVSESGELLMPALPFSMDIRLAERMGTNYLVDQDGRLFLVDKNGSVFEKVMSEHDSRDAKVISL